MRVIDSSNLKPLLLQRPQAAQAAEARQVPRGLARLRAVILLAGSVGTSSLAAAAGRAVIRLPIDSSSALLGQWQSQVALVAQVWGMAGVDLRVLGNNLAGFNGRADDAGPSVRLSIECDPGELRGTGGVLRDVVKGYDDDDYVLVAAAGQLLVDSLAAAAGELAELDADVALFAEGADAGAGAGAGAGAAGSVMLVRCGCLRMIPSVGYIDLKEQALPVIGHEHCVRVLRRDRPLALPLRTRADYVRALRWYHQVPRPELGGDPFAEDWQPVFALREQRGEVDDSARLHDSVVLAGGRVERGAMVVRSVVCGGGVVGKNQTVIDQVVTAARR